MTASASRSARERVIVALDVPDLAALRDYLDRLDGRPAFYKVGLELFVAEGARALEAVARTGGRIFLDLKLHDIPETVARAVASARALGAELLTVHACGGRAMIERAVGAASQAGPSAARPLGLLAVTVLTSLSEEDLAADGLAGPVGEAVARRARLAIAAGVHGLVCSPREVRALRALSPEIRLVVPGIRPAGAAAGDQKRTGTPAEAIADGADALVVGRPIRDAGDPAAAYEAIVAEVQAAERRA